MKGVELPINVIVIVVLALVVLLGILALFSGVWSPGVAGISLEAAKNNACQMLVSTGGCEYDVNKDKTKYIIVNNFDADKDGSNDSNVGGEGKCSDATDPNTHDNLFTLCKCWYLIAGTTDEEINNNCKINICNCPS